MQPIRTATALGALALLSSQVIAAPPARAATADYEEGRLALALARGGWTRVDAPEGRLIGAVHVVRRDVFAEDEPLPTLFNAFHWLTRERVVTRELLFRAGEPWRQVAVDESVRNLRALGIFNVVRVVAVEGAEPDAVDAVVLTRDLWSLRLESSFRLTAGHLDKLDLTLVERNLFGRHKQTALRFELLPKTFSVGDYYIDNRLFGGGLSLTQTFDLVFRREDGDLEGSKGALSIGRPLRTLKQRWSWQVGLAYSDVIGRQLSGSELLTWDAPDTAAQEAIPRRWDYVAMSAAATIVHQSGGADLKHRLSVGLAGSDVSAAPLEHDLPSGDPALERAFRRDVLPRERRQVYPFVGTAGFVPDYETFTNLAGFGLSEDVRQGPWWSALLGFPLEAFGSSDDALFLRASAGWVLAPDGGLLDVSAGVAGRLEQGELMDQVYEARVRGASPLWPFGRLVARAHFEGRRADSAATLVTLGGDSGLRGYPSQAFYGFGACRVRFNVELRTPPLVVASGRVGAIVFWDGGAVYERLSDFALRQSAGVGLRFLFPQFNRYTFRLDVGVPFDGEGFTALVNFGSLQAVPLTKAEDMAIDE